MNKKALLVACMMIASSGALSASGADAASIANGGFEANAASVPVGGVLFGPIPGWNNSGYLTSAGYYSATPPEGRIFALVGNGIDTGGYHMNQTITGLTSGSTYKVNFSLGSEDFVIPGVVEQVNVWMSSGSASASQLYSAPISSNATPYGPGPLWDHWGAFSYSFVANASNATLNFEQTAATTGAGDTGLDKVSISGAIPEPGAWAMMLVGFGGLGAVMRRRRSQAAFAAA